jgi:hypothetical protein
MESERNLLADYFSFTTIFKRLYKNIKLGVVVHACNPNNPSIWEVEAGES